MPLKTMAVDDVKMIVIHCSASKPSLDVGVTEIDQWHRKRGFLKIGYHYVIRRDGTVEKGRELTEPGAHAIGVNSKSIGICMVGGLDEKTGKPANNFTGAQWVSLESTVANMKKQFPKVTAIIGHRDIPGVKKDCPCFNVKQWAESVDLL